MDGFSTQPAATIAGALAAQPSASQERLRRQREARRREASATTDAELEASDAPVEGAGETEAISSKLPDHLDASKEARPEDEQPHLDVTA